MGQGMAGAALFFMLLVFLIMIALTRWIFRINDIIKRLDMILEALVVKK
jgi:hypothetical protein